MKTIRLLFIAVLILQSGSVFAASSPAELKDIPLRWKPTENVSSYAAIDLTVFQNMSFTIKPFTDARKTPGEIGRNVEKRASDAVLYVTTKDDVPAWLTDRFAALLSEFGVPVFQKDGTLTLEADVIKFYVTEASLYKGEVALKIRMRSKSGAVVWESMVDAGSSRWGSSYKAENYYEVLSDTCIDVVYNMLKSESFRQAVQKNK